MDLFYELIQVALGNKDVLSKTPSAAEWSGLYQNCQEQTVAGVAFTALDHLSRQGQKPPLDILYQWIGYSEQIKRQNVIVNKRCVEITKLFAEAGFKTCILKGQGNARTYKDPLSRSSGDIDLWILGHADLTDSTDSVTLRQKVDSFVHSRFPDIKGGKMHIEFPVFKDVAIEVHYIPSYMYSPKYDRRLQVFFREKSEEQCNNLITLERAEGTCAVPTTEFNLVQQLSHMMNHFIGEGIGLRQFIDYYYVLKCLTSGLIPANTSTRSLSPKGDGSDYQLLLKECGLLKFAQGVMWVEKQLLGLEDKHLIAEPSERIGRAIQRTIEEGGNFGHHSSVNAYRHQSTFGRVVGGAKQSFRALRYFPMEATWKLIKKLI